MLRQVWDGEVVDDVGAYHEVWCVLGGHRMNVICGILGRFFKKVRYFE